MKSNRRNNGFTLIEMMVVVVILGVIAAISIPSYRAYVVRTQRAEANALLNENAQFMERFMTVNNRYDLDLAGAAPTLPNVEIPKNSTGANTRYTISFVAGTLNRTGFTMRAVPQGTLASDVCGTFTLDNLGVRAITGPVSKQNECLNR